MFKRQAAFEKKGKFLKGNLHMHTTLSDGQGTPESTIRQYAQSGYDFLALTDHCKYNYINYAPEHDLLIIPGVELDRDLEGKGRQIMHVVAVGPEDNNGFEQDQRISFKHGGKAEECQDIFDTIAEANNLAIVAHPQLSGNSVEALKSLQGFSMIEVWNSGVAIQNGIDNNNYHWDALLDVGRKVYGVASDDSHRVFENGHGFVMVNAEKNVNSIIEALKNGEFYASCGPEIYDFYIENGYACVHCSPVEQIILRNFSAAHFMIRGKDLTAGNIKLMESCTDYVRVEVVDDKGRRAWSQPIFLDE